MCKQTIDENFCDCETEQIEVMDEGAVEDVLNEFQVTRYITREVEAPDTLSLKDESNQLSFVAGLIVAFLIMAIVLLICYLCYSRRQKLLN